MDRREQILRAAGEITAERGVGGLSVRNVATRAGLGASTLRHYFPSQRDLYDAVVGQSFHAQVEDLRIRDDTVAPAQRLTECMQQFLPVDDSRTPELEGWFTLYTAAVGPTRTEQGTRLLATLSHHARQRLDQWLATIESEGFLRRRDRRQAMVLLLTMIDGLCLQLLTPESGTTVADARSTLRNVIQGLVTAPDAETGAGSPG